MLHLNKIFTKSTFVHK